MPTASEKAWGALRPTGGAGRSAFRPSLREPPATPRHPDPKPHTGRESAGIASALRNLGRRR